MTTTTIAALRGRNLRDVANSATSYGRDLARRARGYTLYALAPIVIACAMAFAVTPDISTPTVYGMVLLAILALSGVALTLRLRMWAWKRRAARDLRLLEASVAEQLADTTDLSLDEATGFISDAEFEELNAGLQYSFTGEMPRGDETTAAIVFVRHNGDVDLIENEALD